MPVRPSLPHRFPFRLVDATPAGVRVVLTANAYWTRDAQPLSAAWLVEAAAQASALLRPPGEPSERALVLAGIDGCRFERLPRAGETLELELRRETVWGGLMRVAATLRSSGEPLGELTLTLGTAG